MINLVNGINVYHKNLLTNILVVTLSIYYLSMYKSIWVIALLIIVKSASAQHIADSFQHAETQGYSMQELDKQYPSAIGGDNAVFKAEQEPKFIQAYTNMLTDLAKYLNKNGFWWGDNVHAKIFNRIYFERDGSISYYLVNLEPLNMEKVRQNAFIFLLNNFIQNYKLKMKANGRFAQCSPVLYQDVLKH